MKSGTALAAARVALTSLIALTSFSILAQQPSTGTPANPTAQPSPAQQSPASPQDRSGAESAQPSSQASPASPGATPETAVPASTVPMSAVNGELESALDSKTAKTGDNIVVKTKSTVKTADGTEIPKGSKLMGHVVAVKASEAGATSQVAVQFDHVELKGGQNMAVRSQIQSIGSSDNVASNSGAVSGPSAGPAPAGGGSSVSGAQRGSAGAPQATGSPAAAQAGDAPAPGTVVAKNGNITIQTTSVPGILLANNAPGMQDPRMATASSILLGAKKDIQLDGGTPVVVGVAAAGGAGQ